MFGAAPVLFDVPFGVGDAADVAGGYPCPVGVVAVVLPGHKNVGRVQRSATAHMSIVPVESGSVAIILG